MADARAHDVVLFGATGFTGGLTAEYLAGAVAGDTRWALAGRDHGRLETVRERLRLRDGARAPELLEADARDPESLARIATSARVVATTVGPYIQHGDPLVGACAEAGTDYVDLCGEPEFVDRCYVRHHARAQQTGARLVHACGFDSVPHDLGVRFCVGRLPEGVPLRVEGFVRAGGTFSGGTLESALTACSRLRQNRDATSERKRTEPPPGRGRRARGIRGRPRHEEAVGAWILPLPTIDAQIVVRSARALERYGPDFSYGHYVAIERLPVAAGLAAGAAGLLALAQVPPARRLLQGLRPAGEGPTPRQRAKGWFSVRFVGEGGGRRVVCKVGGDDPGYDETAKMLAESALCLAHDELPASAGQVTTAPSMGAALTERLRAAGIRFEELEATAG